MAKTKTADLSSGLVSVKGRAVPLPSAGGAPGRVADAPEASIDHRRVPEARQVPLNFKVPADFRRAFRTYAASHDMKLNELLKAAFETYRERAGD